MQFPVTHADGRFYVVPPLDKDGTAVHVRHKEGVLDVLVGMRAYRGDATGSNAVVRGLSVAPPPGLLSTLFMLPGARAYVMKADRPAGTHQLVVNCWDAAGVELRLDVGLDAVDASSVWPAALDGALKTVAALESVVAALEAERTAGRRGTATAGNLDEATRRISVKSRPIDRYPAWRRAVERGVAEVGNRAYGAVHLAERLSGELAAEKAARKQREESARKAKLEVRAVYEGREKARKSRGGGARQVIFVDSDDEDNAKKDPTKKEEQSLPKESDKVLPAPDGGASKAENMCKPEDTAAKEEAKATKTIRKTKKKSKRKLV